MKNVMLFLTAAVITSLCVSTASADWEPGKDVAFITIQISNAEGQGEYTYFFPPGLAKKQHDWQLPVAAIVHSKGNGKPMATVDSLDITYIADPVVDLNFAVTAGNSDTTFTIQSAILPFAALTNPPAYASAAVTLTDLNNNGAAITGKLGNGKLYEALANGSAWASLVNSFTSGIGDSQIGKERQPGIAPNWGSIAGSVTNMQAVFSFTLSANDSASATSHFEVVPEPATLALLGLGGILLRKRK